MPMTDDRMDLVRRNNFALPATVAAVLVLGGCGFVHNHFGHKDAEYIRSAQDRPLEVPPDLDTPSTSGALVVPSASMGNAPSTSAAVTGAPSTLPPSAPIAPGVQVGGDGLHVADSPDSTWTRVGLALERSGAATVLSRDEAGHAYAVETTGRTTTKAGWLKRAVTFGHAGNKTTAKVKLGVRVSADGAGSRVSVEGATDDASLDAARSLLAMLRQRLS